MAHHVESLMNNPYLRLKFLGKLSLIGVSVENPETEKELEHVELVYRVDKDGYLMDENCKYLMDRNESLIRLSEEQVEFLDKNKIFYR